jgi:hypothetical protein
MRMIIRMMKDAPSADMAMMTGLLRFRRRGRYKIRSKRMEAIATPAMAMGKARAIRHPKEREPKVVSAIRSQGKRPVTKKRAI